MTVNSIVKPGYPDQPSDSMVSHALVAGAGHSSSGVIHPMIPYEQTHEQQKEASDNVMNKA